jgi:4,5-DOPA dioxygenase extradiol
MTRLPSVFVSHGAPTFALEPGRAGELLRELGERLPRPRAVLVLSPHWITRGVSVSAAETLPTIHDFGGFGPELEAIEYPAVGAPAVARRAAELLAHAGWPVNVDTRRGLDHGAGVPLLHMFPAADVPVVQVSMPSDLDPAGAVRLGRALAPLADEGVLIVGSGSLTHNLYEFRMHATQDAAYASAFERWARRAVQGHDEQALVGYLQQAPEARRAHPTPDHYLPLPFAFGAAAAGAPVEVLEGGMRYGMLSMESYVFGAAGAR